ncbi:MAG TPA: hypothetical protein VIF32_02820 [Gemmatimonadaceae bacterium]|jgi:hypothetical protein
MSRTSVVRSVSFAILLGALAAASGCVSVSPRVWYNGQAMSSSWQYRDVLAGDRNPAKLRAIYYGADARRFGQRSLPPYPAFGRW